MFEEMKIISSDEQKRIKKGCLKRDALSANISIVETPRDPKELKWNEIELSYKDMERLAKELEGEQERDKRSYYVNDDTIDEIIKEHEDEFKILKNHIREKNEQETNR